MTGMGTFRMTGRHITDDLDGYVRDDRDGYVQDDLRSVQDGSGGKVWGAIWKVWGAIWKAWGAIWKVWGFYFTNSSSLRMRFMPA
jgi:hypothetical protein